MADRHRHFLHPLADQDIEGIWNDGADRWGIDQADRYFDGIVNLFDLLSEQPEIARLRGEFTPPVRIHPCGLHVVVFETVKTGIAIIRVLPIGETSWPYSANSTSMWGRGVAPGSQFLSASE